MYSRTERQFFRAYGRFLAVFSAHLRLAQLDEFPNADSNLIEVFRLALISAVLVFGCAQAAQGPAGAFGPNNRGELFGCSWTQIPAFPKHLTTLGKMLIDEPATIDMSRDWREQESRRFGFTRSRLV
jgi:hypothetical protein